MAAKLKTRRKTVTPKKSESRINLAVNPSEFATILAALHLWQSKIGPDDLPAQARSRDDFGPYFEDKKTVPLSVTEIDSLCERINTESVKRMS